MPDGTKFAVIERRHAGCSLLQKALIGLLRIAVFLDDDNGKAGHGSVTAAFRDHYILFMTSGQACIELVIIQKFRKIHATGIEFHVWLLCSEEEASSIQRIRIEIRKDRIDQLLHIAVEGSIRHALDGKEHMELWPCGLTIFLALVETAVVDSNADAGKSLQHICRCDPILWIFRVVIVAVHGKAVGREKIGTVAVMVFIFSAYIVVADRSL